MALPEALRDAAMRLPGLAARLVGVPSSGLPLGAAAANQVFWMLIDVINAFIEGPDDSAIADGAIADALLTDERLRLALLRLVAFAVRGSQPGRPAFHGIAEGALRVGTCLLGLKTPTALRSLALLDFGRKLLRMDTLQCCSSVFAERAAALEAIAAGAGGAAGVADGGGAEAGTAGPANGLHAPHVQPAIAVLRSCALVESLVRLRAGSVGAPVAQCSARERQQFGGQRQLFACELAAALRDSRVLEHCARWALHAQLAVSAGRVAEVGWADTLAHIILQIWHSSLIAFAVADPALREVLSGPCVRHLVLSLGLAALCAADGGSSHGLPDELLLHLPILGVAAEDLRGMHGRQQLFSASFSCMLLVLEDINAASATPPRDWRSGVGLLRRIGSLLLTSARVRADEAAVAGAGPQPSALQLVLGTADIMAVAVPLLEQFRRLVGDQQAAAAGAPAALAEAEAAWWRLAVDVATQCVRWASSSELAGQADLLCHVWGPVPTDGMFVAGSLPAAPPRTVAAALAGGLLPLWERLLRCAGREPLAPEASLLTCMLEKAGSPAGVCDMLAFCEPLQGAALVATWGKLLRTLAVPQLLLSLGEAADTPRTALACGLVTSAVVLLTAAGGPLVSGWYHSPGAAAAEATAPQLQLARLLSFALYDWLPPLACVAREGVLVMRTVQLNLKEMHTKAISVSSLAVLQWLPVLATGSGAELGRAAEEAVGGAAAEAPAASPAAAGWRQVLLRKAGAVALLGDLFPLTSGSADQPIPMADLKALAIACCYVAVACPGEVRQAVLAAAAEAAAAAGSGGWSPQRLQMLADELSTSQAANGAAPAAAASALASQAELWAAGGGEVGGALVRAVAAMAPGSVHDALAGALASSPFEARAVLRTCSNPACDNLAGDSEARLPLRACGRCGGAWYCRKECLAAHWRTGHREACAGRGGTA
ncbi:hypothetical protein TSOC_011650, partial [Tetrabaena socialis]